MNKTKKQLPMLYRNHMAEIHHLVGGHFDLTTPVRVQLKIFTVKQVEGFNLADSIANGDLGIRKDKEVHCELIQADSDYKQIAIKWIDNEIKRKGELK